MCVLANTDASADTVNQTQHLDFGSFVLKRNNAVYQLKVQKNGAVTSASSFIVITTPVPAMWELTDYPPNTLLTVSIPDAILSVGGAGTGNVFNLTDFTPTANLTTDGAGAATLRFGASLYTSGSGTMYADGSYSGDVSVTISY